MIRPTVKALDEPSPVPCGISATEVISTPDIPSCFKHSLKIECFISSINANIKNEKRHTYKHDEEDW